MSPVTLATGERTHGPSTARSRVWILVAVAAAVLVALPWIVVVVRGVVGGHPGGDPGGVRRAAVRETLAAVPPGASVEPYADGPPRWDSCDGRAGTWGWDDIIVQRTFTTGLSTDAVLANASATMAALHWSPLPLTKTPLGPVMRWTKTIGGHAMAHATLAVDQTAYGRAWDLSAFAPPVGQHSSGC
jgi:hypothetical protein